MRILKSCVNAATKKTAKRNVTIPTSTEPSVVFESSMEHLNRNSPGYGLLVSCLTIYTGVLGYVLNLTLAPLKDDLKTVKEDLKTVKENLKNVKEDLRKIDEKMDNIERKLDRSLDRSWFKQ